MLSDKHHRWLSLKSHENMDIVKEEKDKPDPILGGILPEDTSKSGLLYLDESNGLVKLDPVTVNNQACIIILYNSIFVNN